MTPALIVDTLWCDVVNQLPLGTLLLDPEGRVRGWNEWMAVKTAITSQHAMGKTLQELFPGFDHPRFSQAVEEVFSSGSPQLLSHTLNRYVIPIRLEFATVVIQQFGHSNEHLSL